MLSTKAHKPDLSFHATTIPTVNRVLFISMIH